jgi:hypothetical protein
LSKFEPSNRGRSGRLPEGFQLLEEEPTRIASVQVFLLLGVVGEFDVLRLGVDVSSGVGFTGIGFCAPTSSGDTASPAETTPLGGAPAAGFANLVCNSFSVESVSAPAMTEVNKTPHKTILSDLFIFLSTHMISHEDAGRIA